VICDKPNQAMELKQLRVVAETKLLTPT
jgi:hypothetical protein